MASALENLVVKLALDGDDYDEGIKRADGALDSFGANAAKIGGGLSLAVTTPIVAIGGAALGLASDLSETTSKVNTLFGESAAEIQAWSETSDTAFGLSQAAALDAVGGLGNMFMQLGAQSDSAATMSEDMVQLSADIASFHNVAGGSEQVLGAMTSAFRGEYDALQAYIPTINGAAVEQQALAETGKATAAELTNLDKALAVQTLVMSGAGAAVGDYARTADGLANTQRTLEASVSDLGAELGAVLLPMAVDVAHAVSDLVSWFKELSPEAKKWIVVFAGVAAAVGPLLVVLGAMASAISAISGLIAGAGGLVAVLTALTGPIGLIVLAVGALAAAWATDFGGIRTKTEGFWNWITGSWPGWMGTLKNGWQGFSDWWASDTATKTATVKAGWEGFWGWMDDATGGGVSTLEGYWNDYATQSQRISENNWSTIKQGFQTAVDLIKGIVQAGLQIIQGDWSGAATTIEGTVSNLWTNLQGIFSTQLDNIRALFTAFGFEDIGESIAQGIANGVTAGLHWISEAATAAARAAMEAAKSFLGIHSPATLPADEVGAPWSQGVGVGAIDEMPNVARQIQNSLNSMVDGITAPSVNLGVNGATGGGAPQVNIYIYANDYEGARMGVLDGLRQAGLA